MAKKFDKKFFEELLKLEPKDGAFAGNPKKRKDKSKSKRRKSYVFPSQDALDKYLKEHPKADKRRHKVEETKAKPKKTQDELAEEKFGKADSYVQGDLSEEEVEKLYSSIGRWRSWQGSHVAEYGVSQYVSGQFGDGELAILRGENGNLGGICYSGTNDDGDYEIDALASSGNVKGMGTFMIAKVIKDNLREGQSLFLKALSEADSFYEHIGMVNEGGNNYGGHNWSMEYEYAHKFSKYVYGQLEEAEEEKPKSMGRKPNKKTEFLKKMDRAKYDSPEEYAKAKEKVKNMSMAEFDVFLKSLDDEDEDEVKTSSDRKVARELMRIASLLLKG